MNTIKKTAYGRVIFAALIFGCGSIAIFVSSGGSALLVGSFRISEDSFCPDQARIVVNDNPAGVNFDSRCEFVIKDFPTGNVLFLIQVDNLTGTFNFENIDRGEFIEIVVVLHTESLSLSVVRRVKSTEVGMLPVSIESSNSNLQVPAGLYEQSLTVDGNSIILTGAENEQSDPCNSEAGTTIRGKVFINGNNATFRNIKFLGDIEIRGNKARFINSCIGENLLIFGNESTIP